MEEMRARMRKFHGDVPFEQRRSMMTFMWGRRWGLPQMENPPPPKIAERKFWEGSVFGVAIGAESFPGIIAVHANAGYILNFRKEIAVQKRIEELGRQNDIEHIVLLDNKLNILAQSDSRMVQRRDNDPFLHKIQSSGELGRRVVERADGTKYFDVVKAVNLNGSTLGFLEIGLSLEPMEIAWRQSLNSMVVFGLGILLVGILGMGAIFYNQQTHLKRIKALEAEINRQERLSELGNLAATVAHEIRNPLNSVSMGLQRLKAEFSPADNSDEYARFLNLIQGEVQRLNSIVEQFLSLARPLSLKTEAIVLEKFLQELGTLVTGDARPAHVQIELKLEPRLPPLQADPNYLKQLLLNLILNGIQAMPEGGALTIEASAAKDHLELAVTDQGMGMTAETRSKIFEPYFTTKLNGSGLGLPIARKIIEAHGGTISVESAPGRGSRFRLRFPLNRSEV
jgi:signal transduction histidine kinase